MQTSKIKKRIITVVILIVMLALVGAALSFAFVRITYGNDFLSDVERIQSAGENSDMIMVGASRVYRTYVPSVIDEKLDYSNTLNAGSSSQPYSGSYYTLIDLFERFTPKTVIIDASFLTLAEEEGLQAKLLVNDRLSCKNGFKYINECLDKSEWLNLISLYRYRTDLTSVPNNIKTKIDKIINPDKKTVKDGEYYQDRGFVYTEGTVQNGNMPLPTGDYNDYSPENMISENVEYFKKCIELCKDKGVEIYLVTAPISLSRILGVKNYQKAVDFFEQTAKEYGVSYFCLGYLKNREQFFPDSAMNDEHHICGESAGLVTEMLCDLITKTQNGDDTSGDFYSDIGRLETDVHRVVAVGARIEDIGDKLEISIDSVQPKDNDVVYKVEASTDGEDFITVSDWKNDKNVVIDKPNAKKYRIKVSAKLDGVEKSEAYQIY